MACDRKRVWQKRLTRAVICLLLGAAITVAVAWGLCSRNASRKGRHGITVELAEIRKGVFWWSVEERRAPGTSVRMAFYVSRLVEYAEGDVSVDFDSLFMVEDTSDALREAAEQSARSPDLLREPAWRDLPLARWTVRGGWGKLPLPDRMMTTATAAGWPALAVWGWTDERASGGLVDPRRPMFRPYLPVWRGFFLDTLLYAVPWWFILAAPSAIRRWRRRRCGQCTSCGYDLAGLSADDGRVTCPECGSSAAAARLRKRGLPGDPSPGARSAGSD